MGTSKKLSEFDSISELTVNDSIFVVDSETGTTRKITMDLFFQSMDNMSTGTTSIVLVSPNNTKYKLIVYNNGTLGTQAI